LNKEISKLQKDLDKSQNKLSNKNFVDRAPEEVVKKEQARVDEMQGALNKLEAQLDKMGA